MPLRNKFVATAIVVLLSHIAVLAIAGTRWPGPILSDLIQLSANILAAAACFYCFRRSQQLARQFWLLFSLYFTAWSIGQISFIVNLDLPRSTLFTPSLVALLFFIAGAPAAMTLFIESGPRSRLRDWQWLIDFLQVGLLMGGYFWFVYVSSSPDGAAAKQRIEFGFVLRNIILIFAFFMRAYFSSSAAERRLFSIAFKYFILYGSLNAYADYLFWGKPLASGVWIDLSWSLAALLMTALAATWQEFPAEAQRVSASSHDRELPRVVWPSVPPLLIVLMAIRFSKEHAWMAMTMLLLSFVAFAVRLGVTQYGQRIGEQALRSSLSLLEATLESTADGILVVDRSGKTVSFNRRFVELWRIPNSLVYTKDDSRMLDYVVKQLKDPEGFLSKVRELYSRPHEEGYDILQFKDSRVFERYSKPQYVEGEAVGRVWSFRDITQRWFLETQLRHSQKLEAVGRLAGGVAHDFNNVLTVMSGYLQLALNNQKTEPAVAGDLLEIQKAVNHAASLTKQLLAFSRQQVLRPQVLELNDCIASLLQILRRVIPEDIEINTCLEPGLGPVLIDQTQLEQVVMNLAVNARDAMPGGGRLWFETRNVDLDCSYCERLPNCAPGNYSVLDIRDTGAGMEPQTMAHIFEPFFTTKDPGKGTGLGLSTVYGIVKQTGGFIDVKSKVGAGTTFSVFFPQVERAVQPLRSKQPSPDKLRGTETILIVEDNQDLRQLTSKILGANGYKVLEADGGTQAEMICKNFSGKIDLVLSDVVMPGLRGPEVVKRLMAMRPDLRAIFISGFIDDWPFAESVLSEKTEFLQKPFDPPALLAKVREVLDAPAAGSQKISA